MRRVKKWVSFLVISMVVLVTLLFSLENQQPVSLAFVGWSTPQWSVSVYVLGALLLGLAVGPLLAFAVSRRSKPRLGRGKDSL